MLTLAESYFHTLDPVVVQITSGLAVRWYGLAYVAGFAVAWCLVALMSKRGICLVPRHRVADLMTAIVIGVVVGGRLGYVLLYHPSTLWKFESSFPFWEVLAINRGGMSAHGGMIGVMLAAYYSARRLNIPLLHLLDVAALTSPFGLFFGRLANFVNGELLGFPVANQANPPWWSVKFPQEMKEWSAEQLTTLGPAVASIGVSAREYLDAVAALPGDATVRNEATRVVENVSDQLIAATQRHDPAVIESLAPLLTARYPSQLMQALTDGPLLLLILVIVWWKPRKPGIVGAWFLLSYAVMRVVTETWRMPDAGVDLILGLSRGRWLSIGLFVGGWLVLTIAHRAKHPKIGGLVVRTRPLNPPTPRPI